MPHAHNTTVRLHCGRRRGINACGSVVGRVGAQPLGRIQGWINKPGGLLMSRRPSAATWRSVCAFFALAFFAFAAHSQTLPTAPQVAANITVGWNLGNTLEAQCGETAWGNPAVTQAFINSVKAAGFNAIRIPAAWDCH